MRLTINSFRAASRITTISPRLYPRRRGSQQLAKQQSPGLRRRHHALALHHHRRTTKVLNEQRRDRGPEGKTKENVAAAGFGLNLAQAQSR